jgi:hypothetical protein
VLELLTILWHCRPSWTVPVVSMAVRCYDNRARDRIAPIGKPLQTQIATGPKGVAEDWRSGMHCQ